MIFIYITAGNIEDAKKISRHLLEKKLIACVNIFPIQSMYWWKSGIQDDTEFAIIAKTIDSNFKSVREETKKIHTYETPCIVSWKIDNADPDYEKWIEKESKK